MGAFVFGDSSKAANEHEQASGQPVELRVAFVATLGSREANAPCPLSSFARRRLVDLIDSTLSNSDVWYPSSDLVRIRTGPLDALVNLGATEN